MKDNAWINQRLACKSDDLNKPPAGEQKDCTRLSLERARARGLSFSTAALENLEETGIDWELDLQGIKRCTFTVDQLRARCLEGADEGRVQGWSDYVDVIESAWLQSLDGGYAIENPGDGDWSDRRYGN